MEGKQTHGISVSEVTLTTAKTYADADADAEIQKYQCRLLHGYDQITSLIVDPAIVLPSIAAPYYKLPHWQWHLVWESEKK